ncbi:MAG: alkaline phosphatase [Leptospiraceae bacterium]|nr:MAG: alkaline phosphatase [Leptospiraceae bacterium]
MVLLRWILPVNKKDWIYHIIFFWGLFLLILQIERITFYFFYVNQTIKTTQFTKEVLLAFLTGLRYDFAVLPIVFLIYDSLLFFFYLLFCYKIIKIKYYKIISLILFYIEWYFIIHLALANMSSILNYGVNNKHLGWEYFAYFRDLPLFIKSIYTKNPEIIISLFLILFLWLIIGIYFILKTYSIRISINEPFKIRYFIIYLILNIILFRGGIQQNPLRPADALTSKNNFINNLRLNGIFTIIHDASDKDDFTLYYPIEENIKFIQSYFKKPDPFIENHYPLLRYMNPRKMDFYSFKSLPVSYKTEYRYNFIIVVLESWSAKFLHPYNLNHSMYPKEVAPNFNRLSQKGLLFRNSYASGGRSANGIFCILTGIPDRAGRTIFRSNQIMNHFGSLPLLLKEKGYTSVFIHNGDLNFDNLRTALPHLGFNILIGKKEMEKTGKYKNTWEMGYFDEDLYDISFETIQKISEPFFMMIFTSNNHHPYTIPDKRFAIFPETDPEYRFKNSYHYADYALGKFIDNLEKSKFIKNTIIMLIADHTHHTNLNYYEDRQIPFLIYSPYLIKPQIRYDTVSQLDILPTILALTGGNQLYSSIGRDLTLYKNYYNYEPYAFFAGGSNTDIIGMIQLPFIYYHYFHSKEKYLFRVDKEINFNNIASEYPDITNKMDLFNQKFISNFSLFRKRKSYFSRKSDLSIFIKTMDKGVNNGFNYCI